MRFLFLLAFIACCSSLCFAQIDIEANAVIRTDRADGRYLSTRGYVQQKLRNLTPILSFDTTFSKNKFHFWQSEVRRKVGELMDFPVVTPQPPPALVSRVQRDGYVVEKWEIYPLEDSVLPILMLIPDGVSKENPAPAVICYPGTSMSKESLAGEPELHPNFRGRGNYEKNQMAKFYVRQGIVSIAIDNPGGGETSDLEYAALAPDFQRTVLSRQLIDMGWNYVGFSAFSGQQILNWLKTLPFIDSLQIALSGHSLGTEPVMMLAVLNPDLKAVVFSDFLTNNVLRARVLTKPNEKGLRPNPNSLFHCVPSMWRWFDFADLLACIAPMNLLITEGGVTADLKRVTRAYSINETADNFTFRYYKKYQDPADRIDGNGIPEGLDEEEWFKYANVDAPNHYFKAEIAIPWLSSVFSNSTEGIYKSLSHVHQLAPQGTHYTQSGN